VDTVIDFDLIKQIKKICSADDIVICLHTHDALLYYHFNKQAEVDNTTIKESALHTVFDNNKPLIINNVTNSFLYNKTVDNPFKFKIENIAIVPMYRDQEKSCLLGCMILYQAEGTKKIFVKNEIEKTEQILLKFAPKLESYDMLNQKFACIQRKTSEDFEMQLNRAYQFFSSVVHDIRTPIGAIMGFLELLEQEIDHPKLKEYIYAAHRSSEMISALINDVLDFTKIEAGKLEVDKYYFSPMEEFENIAMTFYHLARKKKIDFSIYYDINIPYMILSDPYRVKQILNNFISNALKFTPEHGTINLNFIYDKQTDQLRIDVVDSGIGISEDAIEQIFKPFQQASKSTSSKYGGTGLGLTISKQLSDLLGAKLEVSSHEGVGSTFSLILPCQTIEGTPPSVDREKIAIASQKSIYCIKGEHTDVDYMKHIKKYFDQSNVGLKIITAEDIDKIEKESIILCIEKDYKSFSFKECYKRFASQLIIIESSIFMDLDDLFGDAILLHRPLFPHKLFDAIAQLGTSPKETKEHEVQNADANVEQRILNVLIADDNIINRKLMQEVLKKHKVRPYTASDGEEAIEVFQKYPIDLIFMDEQMPEMNGSEAIQFIRGTPKGKDIPIYSLTGVADVDIVHKIREAGATDILLKPIKNEMLKKVISTHL